MSELDLQRRFFAEEIEAVCRLKSSRLVDAFAAVPRERFLPPGPWMVMSDADAAMALALAGKGGAQGAGPRLQPTPDAEPRRVYHNIGVAIDPSRTLFNGQPATLAMWLDALDVRPGSRVLHVGCGLGYYTAIMAHCAGESGRVLAIDVDEALAARARQNLASYSWVDVRTGDGSLVDGPFDVILINAGVTHPLDAWLDALAPGGRMMVPLTSEMPAMGPTLGKGLVVVVTKGADEELSARVSSVVAVYSAVGIRDRELNDRVGMALMKGPAQWASVTRLRRDAHEISASCWLHLPNCCFAAQ
jgi:protein-L-isoaspartate(D-aspartate) O-methyltransferase